MQRFLIASIVGAAGMWFVNKDLPFIGGMLASTLGNLDIIFYIFQGVVMVVVYRMVSGMLSGPGWGRGLLFGIVIFGVSAMLYTAQAGLSGVNFMDATAEARGAAISFKQIWSWQGAIGWMLTGAIVGAVLDDKAKAPSA